MTEIETGMKVADAQSELLECVNRNEQEVIQWGESIPVTPAQKAKWDAFWDYALELSSRLP